MWHNGARHPPPVPLLSSRFWGGGKEGDPRLLSRQSSSSRDGFATARAGHMPDHQLSPMYCAYVAYAFNDDFAVTSPFTCSDLHRQVPRISMSAPVSKPRIRYPQRPSAFSPVGPVFHLLSAPCWPASARQVIAPFEERQRVGPGLATLILVAIAVQILPSSQGSQQ